MMNRLKSGQGKYRPVNTFLPALAIVLVAAAFLSGFGTAALPANRTPETLGIIADTLVDAQGTVTGTVSLAWTIVNMGQVNSPPLTIRNVYGGDGEVQWTAGYNEDTVAVSGSTGYVASSSVDTAQKTAGQHTIGVARNIRYVAIGSGRMTSRDDILIDGAGNFTNPAVRLACPFSGTGLSPAIPPFCTLVAFGSATDATLASVASEAGGRILSPTSDTPVGAGYRIGLTGITADGADLPAAGSVSASARVLTGEGRLTRFGNFGVKSEDLRYSETSSADGFIDSFRMSMNYAGGV